MPNGTSRSRGRRSPMNSLVRATTDALIADAERERPCRSPASSMVRSRPDELAVERAAASRTGAAPASRRRCGPATRACARRRSSAATPGPSFTSFLASESRMTSVDALVDPHRPGLAVEPLDLAAAHQPEPAHHLHAPVDHAAGHLGRADLGHRREVQRGRAGRAPRPRRPGRSSPAPSRSRSSYSASFAGTGAEPGQRHAELLAAGGVRDAPPRAPPGPAPTAAPATETRKVASVASISLKPLPGSPSRWSSGTRTSSKTTSPSTCGAMIWCGLGDGDARACRPGRAPASSPSPSLHQDAVEVASPALVMNDLWPLTTSSPSVLRRRCVVIARRSEPTSGSVSASAAIASSARDRGQPLLADRVGAADRDRRSCRCPASRTSSRGGRSRARAPRGRRSPPASRPSRTGRRTRRRRRRRPGRTRRSRSRTSGSKRSASSARAAMSAHGGRQRAGLRLQVEVPLRQLEEPALGHCDDPLRRTLVEARGRTAPRRCAPAGWRACRRRSPSRARRGAAARCRTPRCSRCRRAAASPGRRPAWPSRWRSTWRRDTSYGTGRPLPGVGRRAVDAAAGPPPPAWPCRRRSSARSGTRRAAGRTARAAAT